MGIKAHGMLAVTVAGLLIAGCSSTESAPVAPWASGPATVVEVFNNNWLDINVYAVRSGTRMRLGTVRSMARNSFMLPEAALSGASSIRLMAAPIGTTRTHITEGILLQRGDRIEWSVENSLALSHYAVRSR
jgi:hypothetical protein